MPEETVNEVVVEETAPRTQNDRTKRVEDFLLDPEKVLFESIEELSEGIDFIRQSLAGVDLAALEQLQGADGKTYQIGVDFFTDEDLDAIQQFIEQNLPVAGADFPTIEQVNTYIEEKVAEIPTQKGDRGDKGAPGKDGRDGSRDTGADILEKLRKLPKNQSLKIDDIRGLRSVLSSHAEQLSEVEAIKEIVENMRVIIPKLDDNGLQDINGLIEAGTNIVLTGSGTSSDPYVISTNGIVSVEWGDITGSLSDQTDLQNALNAKFDDPTGTTSQYIRGDGSLATFPAIPAGTVTSVGLSAPTGFSVSGSPVTASGTLGLTYATGYEGFTTTLKNLINSALQSGDNISELVNDAGFTTNTGTVTSVGMTVPTGLSVSGSPITSSGTLAVSLASGYVIPTTTELAAKLENITGLISQGTNVTITGAGTTGSPYVINASGGSGGGQVDSIVPGTGIDIDDTDPVNPEVSLDSASVASLLLADSALQSGDNITELTNNAGYITGNQTITLTGDVTGSGTTSITTAIASGVIVNADVNASAAIALTKLATMTASRAVVSDGSGFLVPATTTATEIGYVNGVTSAIQTQLNGKMANPMTTGGDIIYGGASGAPTRLANGSAGQVLTSAGGTSAPTWETPSATFNLTVEESGETPISNVDHIVFDGATVTDDGGGEVTVTIDAVEGDTILDLTELTTPAGTDNMVIVDDTDSTTKRILVSTLSSLFANPLTNDGDSLGTVSLSWSDLFLASGGVVNFANGNVTITHATNSLAVSQDLRVTTAGTDNTSVLTRTGTQTVSGKRTQPRTSSSTTASTLTPDLSTANVYYRTTQTGSLTINAPTGTPVIGETIAIYVDSASAQTLTMNATYIPFGAAFPATTTAGKTLMITAQYNGTNWKTLWAVAV